MDYIQISKERYADLTESEDQVKALNDEMRVLNEKLSAAQTELLGKDNLVNQHAKVAEEAVSGNSPHSWILLLLSAVPPVNESRLFIFTESKIQLPFVGLSWTSD